MDRTIHPKHDKLLTSTQLKIRKLGDRIERDLGNDPVAVVVRHVIDDLGHDLFSAYQNELEILYRLREMVSTNMDELLTTVDGIKDRNTQNIEDLITDNKNDIEEFLVKAKSNLNAYWGPVKDLKKIQEYGNFTARDMSTQALDDIRNEAMLTRSKIYSDAMGIASASTQVMETAVSDSLLQTKNNILENYIYDSDQSVKDAVSARFDDIEQPLKDHIASFENAVLHNTNAALRIYLE